MPISNTGEREQKVFGPDTIAVLAVALEDTLRQLCFVDRNDPAVTMVAKTIIELARRGERAIPSDCVTKLFNRSANATRSMLYAIGGAVDIPGGRRRGENGTKQRTAQRITGNSPRS
jgi:hypothetical protein